MARSHDPDSAGSQFFIVIKDSYFLDGQYAVFGKVLEGMDIVDKIASIATDNNDAPLNAQDAELIKVTISE
jgi:cyclophilin family peptidyl-prolyl cis-trans isomerase